MPLVALTSVNKWYSPTASTQLADPVAAERYLGKVNVPVCNYMYKTLNVLGRCVPYLTVDEMQSLFSTSSESCASPPCGTNDLSSYLTGTSEYVSNAIADLGKCWHVILSCVLIAFIIGLLYLTLMKYCATCIVFSGLVCVIVSITTVTAGLYFYYDHLKEQTEITPQLATYDNDVFNRDLCLGFTIAFAVIDAITICIVLCMCKQIAAACTVLSLAADGVMDMPMLIFYPVGSGILLIVGIVLWVYGALFIATAGEITINSVYGYAEYTYDDTLKGMGGYWLFGLLWITEFTTSVGFMVVAMCFCIWFFTPSNEPIPTVEYLEYDDAEDDNADPVGVRIPPKKVDTTVCCCLPAGFPCCCCSKAPDPGEEKLVKAGGMGLGMKKRLDGLIKQASGTGPALSEQEQGEMQLLQERKYEVDLQNQARKAEFEGRMGGRKIGSATGRLLPQCILAKGIKCTLLHHLGTVAFGSLIIAIIQAARLILEYIEQKYKELNGGEVPIYWKFIFCVMRCCLWCLEKCMKFLNQNAYILTCINGTWFCTSACHAAVVLISKIDYVFITVTITSGMLVFGKLAIALGTAAIGGIWCSTIDDVSSVIFPTVLIALVSYCVAMLYTQVYEMGIDTVLMCFLEADYCNFPAKNLPASIRSYVDNAESDYNEDQKAKNANKKAAPAPAAQPQVEMGQSDGLSAPGTV